MDPAERSDRITSYLHWVNHLRFKMISDIMEVTPYFDGSPREQSCQEAVEPLQSAFSFRQKALQIMILRLLEADHVPFMPESEDTCSDKIVKPILGDSFRFNRPFAIINAGLPCSGRSVGLSRELLPEKTNFYDPDTYKVAYCPKDDSEDAYYDVSVKARNTAMIGVAMAISSRESFVLETTLTDFPLINDSIQLFLERDADIFICYTQIEWETCAARDKAYNQMRKAKRSYLTNKEIVEVYNRSLPTFLELKKRYENDPRVAFRLCENDTDFADPKLVFTKFTIPQSIDIMSVN